MTRAVKQNQTVTFRINEEMIKKIDKLSTLLDRPRSYFLKQGVENILDLYDWQLKKITEGEEHVRQRKFATKTEVNKAFRL